MLMLGCISGVAKGNAVELTVWLGHLPHFRLAFCTAITLKLIFYKLLKNRHPLHYILFVKVKFTVFTFKVILELITKLLPLY